MAGEDPAVDDEARPEKVRVGSDATHLDLSERGLRRVPSSIVRLQRLRRLDLSGNGLKRLLPAHLLSSLRALEWLSLANNRLSRLECVLSLRALPSLGSIDLRGNPALPHSANRLHMLGALLMPPGAPTPPSLLAAAKSASASGLGVGGRPRLPFGTAAARLRQRPCAVPRAEGTAFRSLRRLDGLVITESELAEVVAATSGRDAKARSARPWRAAPRAEPAAPKLWRHMTEDEKYAELQHLSVVPKSEQIRNRQLAAQKERDLAERDERTERSVRAFLASGVLDGGGAAAEEAAPDEARPPRVRSASERAAPTAAAAAAAADAGESSRARTASLGSAPRGSGAAKAAARGVGVGVGVVGGGARPRTAPDVATARGHPVRWLYAGFEERSEAGRDVRRRRRRAAEGQRAAAAASAGARGAVAGRRMGAVPSARSLLPSTSFEREPLAQKSALAALRQSRELLDAFRAAELGRRAPSFALENRAAAAAGEDEAWAAGAREAAAAHAAELIEALEVIFERGLAGGAEEGAQLELVGVLLRELGSTQRKLNDHASAPAGQPGGGGGGGGGGAAEDARRAQRALLAKLEVQLSRLHLKHACLFPPGSGRATPAKLALRDRKDVAEQRVRRSYHEHRRRLQRTRSGGGRLHALPPPPAAATAAATPGAAAAGAGAAAPGAPGAGGGAAAGAESPPPWRRRGKGGRAAKAVAGRDVGAAKGGLRRSVLCTIAPGSRPAFRSAARVVRGIRPIESVEQARDGARNREPFPPPPRAAPCSTNHAHADACTEAKLAREPEREEVVLRVAELRLAVEPDLASGAALHAMGEAFVRSELDFERERRAALPSTQAR